MVVVAPGTLSPTGMVQFNKQPGNQPLRAVALNAAGQAVYTTQIGDLFAGNSAITAACAHPLLPSRCSPVTVMQASQ